MARFIIPGLVLTSLIGCATSPPPAPPPTPVSTPAEPVSAPRPHLHDDGLVHLEPVDFATLPQGPDGALVRRGHALVTDTHRLLRDHVSDGLDCTNCHLQAGTTPRAAPYVGVVDRYPRYRARSGKVDSLEDRINGCMERSMNGTALEKDSEPMQAMVAYMQWLSRDVQDGKKVADAGMPRIQPPSDPDPEHGRALFAEKCTACHGAEGQGMFAPDDQTLFPPLWGERSYNMGAGMARLDTAAAFIKWNMPLNQGGTLTDREAYDIASFFIFQDRPDLPAEKRAHDWPKGEKPADARY